MHDCFWQRQVVLSIETILGINRLKVKEKKRLDFTISSELVDFSPNENYIDLMRVAAVKTLSFLPNGPS